MKLRALLGLLWLLGTSLAHAKDTSPSKSECGFRSVSRYQLWSGNHALTIPQRRLELGLFQSTHYGLGRGVEVSLHPVLLFALPHVELKATLEAWQLRYWTALRVRASYPTLFLGLVSREGSGGLLPKTSSPPVALQAEMDLIGTKAWGTERQHLASVIVGFAVAGHGSFTPTELPLLDFPFLYPRFAALYAPIVPRFAASFEGPLFGKLFYDASVTYYLMPNLPDVGLAYALEPAVALEYRFSSHVAVALALRASQAKYAYGSRFHVLPYADLRVGF